MKSSRVALTILIVLLAAFGGMLAFSAKHLPNATATHFGIDGTANDWMTRQGYLLFMGILGALLPLLMVGIFYIVRFIPKSLINIPNRDHWLAPEHRAETNAFLFRHSLWYASLCILFVAGLHGAVVHANQSDPEQLSGWAIAGVGFGFLFGTILWITTMLNRFRIKI